MTTEQMKTDLINNMREDVARQIALGEMGLEVGRLNQAILKIRIALEELK